MSATSAAAHAQPSSSNRTVFLETAAASSSGGSVSYIKSGGASGGIQNAKKNGLAEVPKDLWGNYILPFLAEMPFRLGAPLASLVIKDFACLGRVSKTINPIVASYFTQKTAAFLHTYLRGIKRMKEVVVTKFDKNQLKLTEELVEGCKVYLPPRLLELTAKLDTTFEQPARTTLVALQRDISRTTLRMPSIRLLSSVQRKIALVWKINTKEKAEDLVATLPDKQMAKSDKYAISLQMIDCLYPDLVTFVNVVKIFSNNIALRNHIALQPGLEQLLFRRDQEERTIAHVAASLGKLEILQWLASQPNLKCLLSKLDKNENTVAHVARRDPGDLPSYYFREGANQKKAPIFQWILSQSDLKPLLFNPNKNGDTVAHIAAIQENLETLEWILTQNDLKPLLFNPNKNGDTVAHVAAIRENLEILKWILAQEDLKPLLFNPNKNGDTVAHVAAIQGNLEIL
ncbi:MAG TPA: ankyrin repeat domain-containing protein, partial [Chlamydiales bacterium]